MRIHALLFLSALVLPSVVLADGSVEGALLLDNAPPVQTSAGYKPQTSKPVLKPENVVAIVYLENATQSYPAPSEALVTIDQQGYQFRPSIVAVQLGSRVSFPNRDDEFHNVFSYSKSKRFDLGRFRREDTSPVVVFDKAGVVKVYCEIHQHMRCVLLVLKTPWFTRTNDHGMFRITGVPSGDYTLKAFFPSERVIERPVHITDGRTLKVEINR